MSIVYTGANGGSFTNTITGPSPGDLVTAASVGVIAQGAANLSKRLFDTKVERTGDTMTGTLTVNGTAATNNAGISATGDGTGPGMVGAGGATSGTGVTAIGGAPNGKGGDFTGTGTGTGVKCTSGTGRALDVGTGNQVFTGTSPAATADPGANNLLSGANVCKAWARLEVSPGGGGSVTLQDGYNIASVAINGGGSNVLVTFARAFSSANYAPATARCDAGAAQLPGTDNHTTTSLTIHWVDLAAAGAAIAVTSLPATVHVSLHVFGRQ